MLSLEFVWGVAARRSKANKQARLVEGKVCFISDAGNCGGRVPEICPRLTPAPDKQGVRVFTDRIFFFFLEGRLHAETVQTSLTVVFKWSSAVWLASSWAF